MIMRGRGGKVKMLPFFSSEYSIGDSILTLAPTGKSKETGPKSILDIAIKHNLKQVFLVESNLSGFVTAYNVFKEAKLQLCFGLKLTICRDVKEKTDESRNTEHKVIIFLRRSAGYSNLIKIWNRAATDNFYYYPRADFNLLKQFWADNYFLLMVPFYSSFLARNSLGLYECMFDNSFTKPIFTLEESSLPFDYLIKERTEEYCKNNNFNTKNVRSIYYRDYKDFSAPTSTGKPYFTYRCIHNRSSLDKPEISHFSSDRFCFEDYLKHV